MFDKVHHVDSAVRLALFSPELKIDCNENIPVKDICNNLQGHMMCVHITIWRVYFIIMCLHSIAQPRNNSTS